METSGYNLWGGQRGRDMRCPPCPTVILEKCLMDSVVTEVTALSPLPCWHWDEGWASETEGNSEEAPLPPAGLLPSLFISAHSVKTVFIVLYRALDRKYKTN